MLSHLDWSLQHPEKTDGVWKSYVEKSTRSYTLNLEMNGTSMYYTPCNQVCLLDYKVGFLPVNTLPETNSEFTPENQWLEVGR